MAGTTNASLRKTTSAVSMRRLAAAIAILFIFVAVSIGARSVMGRQKGISEAVTEVEAREVGSAATFRSFGKTGRFFRVAGVKVGARVPLKAADAALLQPASIRLFLLNSRTLAGCFGVEIRCEKRNHNRCGAWGRILHRHWSFPILGGLPGTKGPVRPACSGGGQPSRDMQTDKLPGGGICRSGGDRPSRHKAADVT
ncbi:MAG: hypothetical protein AABN33_16820 [Acidobacteriota bacterium]